MSVHHSSAWYLQPVAAKFDSKVEVLETLHSLHANRQLEGEEVTPV